MNTLTLMRTLIDDSRTHNAELDTLCAMLRTGHQDSVRQRAIAANALTRWQRTLEEFRQRWPNRDDQMIRIILDNR